MSELGNCTHIVKLKRSFIELHNLRNYQFDPVRIELINTFWLDSPEGIL